MVCQPHAEPPLVHYRPHMTGWVSTGESIDLCSCNYTLRDFQSEILFFCVNFSKDFSDLELYYSTRRTT